VQGTERQHKPEKEVNVQQVIHTKFANKAEGICTQNCCCSRSTTAIGTVVFVGGAEVYKRKYIFEEVLLAGVLQVLRLLKDKAFVERSWKGGLEGRRSIPSIS